MYGAVADDFTGATDLAGNWRSRGLRTAVALGVPDSASPLDTDGFDAIVVALKIRSVPAQVATEKARAAGVFLLKAGCTQIYDKYCSTFDSTPEGNIGPIADELTELTGATRAVVVPSFPDAGRTVYQGYHFVGDQLLSESSMRHHPLNPMTDSSLVRLMAAQTDLPVGSVSLSTVRRGADELRKALDQSEAHYIVVDAIDNDDLAVIAEATRDDVLVTGGSGIALGLPRRDADLDQVHSVSGRRAILSGSASAKTQKQVRAARDHMKSWKVAIDDLTADIEDATTRAAEWTVQCWEASPDDPVLIYSVDSPNDVEAAKKENPGASVLLETFFGMLAQRLSNEGCRQFIIAGGETSGAVMTALDVRLLELGEQIDPGVSWLLGSADDNEYNLVLKSGNFGADDLFTSAWEELSE